MQIVWEYESGVQTETAKQNNTLNNYSHNNNRKKSEMKKRRRTKKCKSTYTLVPKAKQIRGIWRGVAICASNGRDGQAKERVLGETHWSTVYHNNVRLWLCDRSF